MIQDILIKNSPVFTEAQLTLSEGFNVFSGASGVGKSVLMESILALFGHKDSNASVIEAHFSLALNLEEWGIESEEETTLSILKKDKTRYFINAQSIPKSRVIDITKSFVKYLGAKNIAIEEGYLLGLLDLFVASKEADFKKNLQQHAEIYHEYMSVFKEYEKLSKEEQKLEELKEFARFEIQKIAHIAPRVGEYDELIEKKRLLSKSEKINELSMEVEGFIEKSSSAIQLLSLLDRDSGFLDEALLELKGIIDEERERLEELLEVDVGEILERISLLSDIKKRYGDEALALEYMAKKQEELAHYENLSVSKNQLESKLKVLEESLHKSADRLSLSRHAYLKDFEKAFNDYLKTLHLRSILFALVGVEYNVTGRDDVELKLSQTELKNVSSGEFSRIRLALLALEVSLCKKVGVLILDEVDANLSGEESEGVAKILSQLAKSYQILAISHQAHMPVLCDRHFLVYKESKEDSHSLIKVLEKEDQVQEVARMISGSEITQEALSFARKRLEASAD